MKTQKEFHTANQQIVLRPQEILIRLPDGTRQFSQAILAMFAKLKSNYGMTSLETFWPLGVPVVMGPAAPPPPTSRWNLGELLTEDLKWIARLRLLAKVPDANMADALNFIRSVKGVQFAARVPQRTGPTERISPTAVATRPGPPEPKPAASKPNIWGVNAVFRPSAWDDYVLNNIAVLDCGGDTTHPALISRVTPADEWSNTRERWGHSTFICGQLVGSAVKRKPLGFSKGDELPAGFSLLPKSKVWLMSVAIENGKNFSSGEYTVQNGVYSFSLWLLGSADSVATPLRTFFKLDPFHIQVVNLSLGNLTARKASKVEGRDPNYVDIFKDESELIGKLDSAGISVVACVHNMTDEKTTEVQVKYPAAFKSVLAVGGIDGKKKWWPRSRYGSPDGNPEKEPSVDLAAPAVNIWSTYPIKHDEKNGKLLPDAFIKCNDGTSFAAPYVTAAVAVLRAGNPDFGPADIRSAFSGETYTYNPDSVGKLGRGILTCEAILLPQ